MRHAFIIRDCDKIIIGRPSGYATIARAKVALRRGSKALAQAERALQVRQALNPYVCTLYRIQLETI